MITSTEMTLLIRVLVLLLLAPLLSAAQTSESAYGTLIGAYGNKHGLVLITDSMLSTRDEHGTLQPDINKPGQKLLKLDDFTACAVAGLNWSLVKAAPTLNADILGLIDEYRRGVHARLPMQRTLNNIGQILLFYVQNVAHIEVVSHQLQNVSDFNIELLLAGFDVDGQAKIGSLVIKVHQPFRAEIAENKVEAVGNEFNWQTHGLNEQAESYLNFPNTESYFPGVKRYAQARVNPHDKATSLTIVDMENLGRDLIHATYLVNPYVGGEAQLAILEGGKVRSLACLIHQTSES